MCSSHLLLYLWNSYWHIHMDWIHFRSADINYAVHSCTKDPNWYWILSSILKRYDGNTSSISVICFTCLVKHCMAAAQEVEWSSINCWSGLILDSQCSLTLRFPWMHVHYVPAPVGFWSFIGRPTTPTGCDFNPQHCQAVRIARPRSFRNDYIITRSHSYRYALDCRSWDRANTQGKWK